MRLSLPLSQAALSRGAADTVQTTLAIGVPIAAALAAGELPYGVIAAFGGMMGTLAAQFNGGGLVLRIQTIACTVLGVLLGAVYGTLMERNMLLGAIALFTAALVAGRAHGGHPIVETVGRFAAIGVAIGVGVHPTDWKFAAFYSAGAAVAV